MKTDQKLAIYELLGRAAYGLVEKNIDRLAAYFSVNATM
jgi:hypothetical protein